jgi:hypothetical protein
VYANPIHWCPCKITKRYQEGPHTEENPWEKEKAAISKSRTEAGPEETNPRMAVAHTCNPSYLGGRDQEDRDLKPAKANSLRDPISNITKKGWWSSSSVSSNPSTTHPLKKDWVTESNSTSPLILDVQPLVL